MVRSWLLVVGLPVLAGCGSAATPPVLPAQEGAAPRVQPDKVVVQDPSGPDESLVGPLVLELPLAGFQTLLVMRPRGAGPFPVLVATHGAGGLAEAHCDNWWRLLGGTHLIACPRGQPLFRTEPERGYFYPNHHKLGEELTAAVEQLRTSDLGGQRAGWIFAGYSQGATMGALAISERSGPSPFDRLVLVEGGYDTWSVARAVRVAEAGVRKVLLVCGGQSCAAAAPRAKRLLEAEVPEVRVVDAPSAGHTYLGEVRLQLERQLDWLVSP